MEPPKAYTATKLKLASKFWDLLIKKQKISTIRRGIVFFNSLVIPITSHNNTIDIRLLKLDYSKKLSDLNELDARNDGFNSLNELIGELKKFYPDIREDEQMTIIYFSIEDDYGNKNKI